jgi:ABC-type glycerol-3-phosphate transport system substrate-binding protein
VNLDKYESVSQLSKVAGIQYFAKNTNVAAGTYAAPTENQFYIMFYNKALFRKAGIKSPPLDFSEAMVDGKLLKQHGILPFVYGSALGLPDFSAVFDWSYLAAGPYSLQQWNGLLDGSIPYTSAPLVTALTDWHAIYAAGLVNSNALNAPNALPQFEKGKAAMLMSYSGYIPTFQQALGANNVGVMAPPWSTKPSHVIAGMPGYGFAALSASKNVRLAAAFESAIISVSTQKLVANSGQIPVVPAAANPKNGLQLQLLGWDTNAGYRQYPMFDNLSQPSVTDVLVKELPAVFVGQTSAQSAASALQSALTSLPASDRNPGYHLGQK